MTCVPYAPIVMVDVDGVLADFSSGFTRLARQIYGPAVPLSSDLTNPRYGTQHLMAPEYERRTWDVVRQSSTFWLWLPPLVTPDVFERLDALDADALVYYVTARPGATARHQTVEWLRLHGVKAPTVVVSLHKGLAAAALEADYAIEDCWDNARDIVRESPSTVCALVDRPYNRTDTPGVRRVAGVEEFLTLIQER